MYIKTSYRLGVRTLVFQSNNAGSNPASLNLEYNFDYKTIAKNKKKYKLNYSLKFISLISPNTITNLSLLENTAFSSEKHKRLLVKQSYILLIWIMYLKGKYSKFDDNQQIPSFFIHKKSRYKTTKLKTPMAHKTFSQEQFLFKFYSLSISFSSAQNANALSKNANASIYIILLLRNSIPSFSTNLLFLKSLKLTLSASDTKFMLV